MIRFNKLLVFLAPVLFALSCKEPIKDMKDIEVLVNILERKSIRQYTDREISSYRKPAKSRDGCPFLPRQVSLVIYSTDKAILKTMGERLKTASCLKEAKNKFDVQKIHYDKW